MDVTGGSVEAYGVRSSAKAGEKILPVGIGSGSGNQSGARTAACVEIHRYTRDARLARILAAVAIEVIPDEVPDPARARGNVPAINSKILAVIGRYSDTDVAIC